jgi:cytochrome c-type biogenesis protein CcmH
MRALAVLLGVLALLAMGSGAALAATPKTTLNDLEDEVMCDTCNVPLNIAESARADQERAQIRRLIAQGLTKQQIKDRLQAEYGPAILATPQHSGFSLVAWWVPIIVVAALAGLLVALLPRWRARQRADAVAGAPRGPDLSAADSRRLDEDLARYDL